MGLQQREKLLLQQFGETIESLGEFGGALMSFTLYAPALKALKSNVTGRLVFGGRSGTGIQIPKMRKLYVSMLKGLGVVRSGSGRRRLLCSFCKTYRRVVQELFARPTIQRLNRCSLNMLQSYKQMTESLLEITLPNGERAFNEEEILTLLANVTQIGVLRSYGEELNSVMNVQKLTRQKIPV